MIVIEKVKEIVFFDLCFDLCLKDLRVKLFFYYIRNQRDMIDDNASYIGATIQDQESIDAYERIGETLREQETPDEFMGIITTTMIFLPHLICLENILYIIDDRYVRPANLVGISGRDLLDYQISIGEKLNEYPDAMIGYYREKYDLERGVSDRYPEDTELACTLWTLHHALVLSYELRNYVSMMNKVKYQLKQRYNQSAHSMKEQPCVQLQECAQLHTPTQSKFLNNEYVSSDDEYLLSDEENISNDNIDSGDQYVSPGTSSANSEELVF